MDEYKLKQLDDDPNGPTLLSSIIDSGMAMNEWNFIVSGSGGVEIFNDTEDWMNIDQDFIRVEARDVIMSHNSKGARISPFFVEWVARAFDEGEGHPNHIEITSDKIKAAVRYGKIVNDEVMQVFGLLLGIYLGLRSGRHKFFMPKPEIYLHPSRQCKIGNVMKNFSDAVNQKIRDAFEAQK